MWKSQRAEDPGRNGTYWFGWSTVYREIIGD